MKSFLWKRIILAAVALIVISLLSFLLIHHNQASPIVYEYKKSIHNGFYLEDGYVVFDTVIKLKNQSSKDQSFFIYADVSEDLGLVTEKLAPACEKETLRKITFFIKANSEAEFNVFFRAEHGDKNTKINRLPPKNLYFHTFD